MRRQHTHYSPLLLGGSQALRVLPGGANLVSLSRSGAAPLRTGRYISMSLADLAALGSFVSGVAVLISLVYLSLQIRQNTKHSRALIQQGRAARIADTALRLAEFPDAEGFDKCFEGRADVTAGEVRRFLQVARAVFISAEDSYFQHRQGLLDDIAFESFEAGLRNGLGSKGIGAAWKLTRGMYEPEFQAYVDRTLGDLNAGIATDRIAQWRDAIGAFERGDAAR